MGCIPPSPLGCKLILPATKYLYYLIKTGRREAVTGPTTVVPLIKVINTTHYTDTSVLETKHIMIAILIWVNQVIFTKKRHQDIMQVNKEVSRKYWSELLSHRPPNYNYVYKNISITYKNDCPNNLRNSKIFVIMRDVFLLF